MPSLRGHLADLQRSYTCLFNSFSRKRPPARRRWRSIIQMDCVEPLEIRAVLSAGSLLGLVGQLESTVLSVPSALLGNNSSAPTGGNQVSTGSTSNSSGISLGNVLNQTLGNLNVSLGASINGLGLSLNLSQSSSGGSTGLLGILSLGSDGINLQLGSSSTTNAFGLSNSPSNGLSGNNAQAAGIGGQAINTAINPAIGPSLSENGMQLSTVINGLADKNLLPATISSELVASVGPGLEGIRVRHYETPVNVILDRDDADDAIPADRNAAVQRRQFELANVPASAKPKQAAVDTDGIGEEDAFLTANRSQRAPIAVEPEAASNVTGPVAAVTVFSAATLLARHFARSRDDALDSVFADWHDHPIDESI